MTTIEQFVKDFMDIQYGVQRDHPGRRTPNAALCHVLHRDLGLGETPRDDAEEMSEAVREAEAEAGITDEPLSANDLDFTVEHAQLHAFLDLIRADAMRKGSSVSELIAAMFIIGRRYGMREAAEAFGSFDAGDSYDTEVK